MKIIATLLGAFCGVTLAFLVVRFLQRFWAWMMAGFPTKWDDRGSID